MELSVGKFERNFAQGTESPYLLITALHGSTHVLHTIHILHPKLLQDVLYYESKSDLEPVRIQFCVCELIHS